MPPLVLFLLLLALQQLRVVLQLVLVSLQRLLRVLQLVPRLRAMLRCLLLLVLMLLSLLLLVLMLLRLLHVCPSGSLPLLCHGASLLLQQPLRFAFVTIAVCADVLCEPLWFVLVLFPRPRWSQHLRGSGTHPRNNIPTHLCSPPHLLDQLYQQGMLPRATLFLYPGIPRLRPGRSLRTTCLVVAETSIGFRSNHAWLQPDCARDNHTRKA